MKNSKTYTPLTPAVFHILLALAQGDKHGYGIMKQVEFDSEGKVFMGPGTLYGSISRMIGSGLIEESEKKIDPKMDDQRRIYYKITGHGEKVLRSEIDRYESIVKLTKKKSLAFGWL